MERWAVLPPYLTLFICVLVYLGLALWLAQPAAHALDLDGASFGFCWLVILFATPLIGLLVVVPMRSRILADQAENEVREESLRAEGSRQEFEARLHRSLETVDTEEEALEVVHRALGYAVDDSPVELLLADSSRAHLRVAVSRGAGGVGPGPGCTVDSPSACPAVRRGQTVTTSSSRELDACPKLWTRDEPCSAVCVPITVMGGSIGVLHATGPDGVLHDDDKVNRLETVASRSGSRIALLRAMEKSQLQAATDSLTGLLNRRSLESRVRGFVRDGVSFAVVMADLDHFKTLNDTHGHDAGDRALRLFSRVLASSLRPEDVVCRYGGEEFVVVMPECDAAAAASAMERVREGLALALTHGGSPGFTASFGVTDGTVGVTFPELLEVADVALSEAKRSGRNRVVVDLVSHPMPLVHAVDDEGE